MLVAFLLGFFLGVLALIAVECAALLWTLNRLRRKVASYETLEPLLQRDLDGERPLSFPLSKKGIVWILEPDKVPKVSLDELPTEVCKEQKKKKNVLEVIPVKRYAEVKDQALILSSSDGSKITIQLVNCTVVAVSASNLPSKKWAKRYPIKLESKEFEIYNGSRTLYLYFETSWEKESWCKTLRLASCLDKTKWHHYAQLGEDFSKYLASLNAEYPYFLKPLMFSGEVIDRSNKNDGASKVRHFLKKLAKKASKTGLEAKINLASSSYRGERKVGDRLHTLNEVSSSDGSPRNSFEEKFLSNPFRDTVQQPSLPSLSLLRSKGSNSNFSDTATDEKLIDDEGTLCWNLLFSRLFFDAKKSMDINKGIKARIQKALSDLRIPSYIGEITCTKLDLGNVPPYLNRMRVFPMDLNEVWAIEVDIEYSGGILLDIETRLEVREPELQQDIIKTSIQPNSPGEIDSELLEGIEHYGSQLKSASSLAVEQESRNVDKGDVFKQSKSGNWASGYASRWKAILHSIADQVSQVPISLAIRVASLRGTLRIQLKPPPSDQLWFGFTSMPEIDWNLESSIGEKKITNTRIAFLITNRLKAAIRENLVLPNCEGITIPWMISENDDWVPCKSAPFIWINQEPADAMENNDISNPQLEDYKSKTDGSSSQISTDDNAGILETIKDVVHVQKPTTREVSELQTSTGDLPSSMSSTQPLEEKSNDNELRTPLLRSISESMELPQPASPASALMAFEERTMIDDGEKAKKGNRRTRMLDFGKKMGDKLEEKRRHLEEKSRSLVERMRDNGKQ